MTYNYFLNWVLLVRFSEATEKKAKKVVTVIIALAKCDQILNQVCVVEISPI